MHVLALSSGKEGPKKVARRSKSHKAQKKKKRMEKKKKKKKEEKEKNKTKQTKDSTRMAACSADWLQDQNGC